MCIWAEFVINEIAIYGVQLYMAEPKNKICTLRASVHLGISQNLGPKSTVLKDL